MSQPRRFRPLATLLALGLAALAAPAAGALDLSHASPLEIADLGAGASLELRSRPQGIEVRLKPGDGFEPTWVRVSLATPRGSQSAAYYLRLPGDGAYGQVLVPRPSNRHQDRDLRLVMSTRSGGSGSQTWVSTVSRFHRTPRVLLLGDATIAAGSRFSPRVVVRLTGGTTAADPLPGAQVAARLVPAAGGRAVASASGTTDSAGATSFSLDVPERLSGSYELEVEVVDDEEGSAKSSFPLDVRRQARVLLSTDKPIYQPGQTVHVRLLARNAGSGRSSGNSAAEITIEDARGNKVFQRRGRTSPEGVFSATFDIASLVNTGRWRIKAKVAGGEVERTVEVKPYVLPKFKVTVTTERASYRPGDTLKGSINARYFFGKPVAGGTVSLRARTFDVRANEVARLTLELDDNGTATFEVPIPQVLHGQPMMQGAAAVQLVAEVTDTAGQMYQAARSVPVWKDQLRLLALPEAGQLVPGIDNSVYVVVSRPDGTPAANAKVTVSQNNGAQVIHTDATGVATWRGVPRGTPRWTITATTADGSTVRQEVTLPTRANATAQVLLRPADPAPRVGQTVAFDVLVSGAVPHVFMDIVRGGQTLVTLSAPVRAGRARLTTTLPPDSAGTVLAHAYALGHDMEVYADTRPLVIRPASDLSIEMRPDRDTYRPGEEATVELSVTDREGHPVLAALGLWVVDEAVFALSELRPGMEKVFFLLEQELMAPTVEVHGFHPNELVHEGGDGSPREAELHRQQAARVLAAAAMTRFAHTRKVDSSAAAGAVSAQVWQTTVDRRFRGVRRAVGKWVLDKRRIPTSEELELLMARSGVRVGRSRDPFGVAYSIRYPNGSSHTSNAQAASAGPDAAWNTPDDMLFDLGVAEAQQTLWNRTRRFRGRHLARRGMRQPMMMDGAVEGVAEMAPMPAGAAQPADRDESERTDDSTATSTATGSGGEDAPRIRKYFPETLYVNPLVVTDRNGRARVTFPVADSITTWRMSAMASSASGMLGSKDAGLRVFQDFFVDVDLPVALTQGDEVTVPLAVYNYLQTPQTVTLELKTTGSVGVQGERKREVRLSPGEVRGLQVDLFASTVGSGTITVIARGDTLSDAVRRDVRVEPNGYPVISTTSGMLDSVSNLEVEVPRGAIAGATTLQVKLFPGMFAQVVDGLDGMLRMPSGCFEQTSSSTYPNILVLRYLRDANKSKPELEAKALRYLQAGWQRLVTFEVPGGGFSWFGQAPANQILTAYGVMEFFDMNQVYEIDEKVLARTRKWLLRQQKGDGSFAPDQSFLHQESWGDIQKSNVLVTAYIAWALAYTRPNRGAIDPNLRKALDWLRGHTSEIDDPYVLSYLANAFVEAAEGRPSARADRDAARDFLDRLARTAVREGQTVHFPTKLRTATHGSGDSAVIEVTSLALRAFMRGQSHMDLIGPGLEWLVGTKSAWGHWHTTQATIQVLQAMVASLSAQQQAVAGSVDVKVNGELLTTVEYTKDDFDVVRFVDASSALTDDGANRIELAPSDGLKAMFTVTRTAYLPWTGEPDATKPAFEVDVKYDRTTLAKDDTVGVTVTVKSNLPGKADMGIVDVAVPPGFVVESDALEAAVQAETLQRYSIAGRQIILYVPQFTPDAPFQIKYTLRARFPVRVSTGATRAYEYYNPQNSGVANPDTMTVR